MTDFQLRVQTLSDAEAIALLRRFVRALAKGSPTPEAIQQQARSMVEAVSLTAEHADDPMGPGELARSALLLLASDARFQSALDAMQSSARDAFTRGAEQIDANDLLTVLQTQLPASSAGVTAVSGSDTSPQSGLVRALTRQLLNYAGSR